MSGNGAENRLGADSYASPGLIPGVFIGALGLLAAEAIALAVQRWVVRPSAGDPSYDGGGATWLFGILGLSAIIASAGLVSWQVFRQQRLNQRRTARQHRSRALLVEKLASMAISETRRQLSSPALVDRDGLRLALSSVDLLADGLSVEVPTSGHEADWIRIAHKLRLLTSLLQDRLGGDHGPEQVIDMLRTLKRIEAVVTETEEYARAVAEFARRWADLPAAARR